VSLFNERNTADLNELDTCGFMCSFVFLQTSLSSSVFQSSAFHIEVNFKYLMQQ